MKDELSGQNFSFFKKKSIIHIHLYIYTFFFSKLCVGIGETYPLILRVKLSHNHIKQKWLQDRLISYTKDMR